MSFEPNAEQQRAIGSLGGPLVITAGAGSGKTWVLARRFVNGVSPYAPIEGWSPAGIGEVLAITYTDKAAGELAERVRRACAQAGLRDQARHVDEAWISTIHGFCSRLLRRHALEIGLDAGFRIVRDVESGALRARVAEDALRESSLADDGVAALVESLGWGGAIAAIQNAYDRARAMGRSAAELGSPLKPAEPGEVDALVARARSVYERASTEFAACAEGVSVRRCRDDAAAGLEEIASIQLSEGDDVERAALLRAVPCEYRFDARVAKETVNSLRDELEPIADRATEIVASRAARALIAATRTFERRIADEKTALGVVDFEDLQLAARDALREAPGLAEKYRRTFRLVMIDEFQDTNELQTEIVRLVSSEDLCTVGDEHQSIYGFRFADVDNFRAYVSGMRDAGALSVPLTLNYRSHGDIIGFVNAVFAAPAFFGEALAPLAHARDEAGQGMADWPAAPRVSAILCDSAGMNAAEADTAQAELVGERVARLVASGVRQNDIAVLMRTLGPMPAFESAMRRRGLRVAVAGGGDFFADPAVAPVRALVRTIANTRDDEALAELLAGPMVEMSADGLYAVRRAATDVGAHAPLWAGLQVATLGRADAERAQRVGVALDGARSALGTTPLSAVILGALEALEHDVTLLHTGLEGEHAYANTLKLARLADAFEETGGAGIAEFITWLDTKEAIGDREAPASVADDSTPAVRFMTIHAAKGLEFPVVVLPILGRKPPAPDSPIVVAKGEDGPIVLAALPPSEPGDPASRRPPSFREALEAAKEAEARELRRLFYVGCTRAREALILAGKTRLEGARGDVMMTWLRQALDIDGPVAPGALTVDAGGTPVDVTVVGADSERPWEADPTVVPAVGEVSPPAAGVGCGDPVRDTMDRPALVADDEVSYTRLERFEHCGRGFLLESMARIGGVPEQGAGPLAFGDTVHSCLRLAEGLRPPDDDRVRVLAKGAGLDAEETARLREAVQAALRAEPVVRASSMGAVRHEAPFTVALGERGDDGTLRPPVLLGSMDLVARDVDGSALVVDYKTGRGGAEKSDDDLLVRYRLQAECYATAVLDEGTAGVEVAFVFPEVSESGGAVRYVQHRFVAGDLETLKEDLRTRIAAMRTGPYERRASWDPGCRHCPAHGGPLCDVRGPARGRGTRR